MSAQILDGNALSAVIKKDLQCAIQERLRKQLAAPGLTVILVGDNASSATYVQHKEIACKEVGIQSTCLRLPTTTTQQELLNIIEQCNRDPNTHGILLQLPLPSHIHAANLLEKIHPQKDVDGFHPYNLGRLLQRRPALRPCTPYGVIQLLKTTGEDLNGKHAVIVGASNIVGRPMALELLLQKCTTTVCHRFTKNLEMHVKQADLLISAAGKPGLILSEWIKPGAIVVDVGFTKLDNGKIAGDIDFETAKERASWITPVPGGVGPMTIAMLLENTLLAAESFD